jgi:hypothetical protein
MAAEEEFEGSEEEEEEEAVLLEPCAPLQIGDEVPNFTADTHLGTVRGRIVDGISLMG